MAFPLYFCELNYTSSFLGLVEGNLLDGVVGAELKLLRPGLDVNGRLVREVLLSTEGVHQYPQVVDGRLLLVASLKWT